MNAREDAIRMYAHRLAGKRLDASIEENAAIGDFVNAQEPPRDSAEFHHKLAWKHFFEALNCSELIKVSRGTFQPAEGGSFPPPAQTGRRARPYNLPDPDDQSRTDPYQRRE